MTIRLTASTERTMMTLRIDGHLTRADVPRVIYVFAAAGAALRLDLTALRSADADAQGRRETRSRGILMTRPASCRSHSLAPSRCDPQESVVCPRIDP